ncbi:geranylgeranyl reductase family protein [Candidatus Rubidus massiliensis]|nr:geranylgeranyl reductase family protein [Candidatus Rubidus massiliensis]
MTSNISKSYKNDYLLVVKTLASNKFEKNSLKVLKRLSDVTDQLPFVKSLYDAVNFRIKEIALKSGLYFRTMKPVAVVSGAGIAGLAASFELRVRGFNVVIVEKRESFSRFNVINLNIETQAFFKKFDLLEKFERFVAAKIKEHRNLLVDKDKFVKFIGLSVVGKIGHKQPVFSFEPRNFNKLFNQNGVYSVPIGVLQTFLAENALERGVTIIGNTTVKILSRTQVGGVSKIQITFDRILKPDLFFIAEGVHSRTVIELGMKTREMTNVCTGENWIFGNMSYFGKETFVMSLIDVSEKTLRLTNLIFNAKAQVINIAVTSDREVCEYDIRKQIQETAQQVFNQKAFPLEKMHSELLTTVSKPVSIVNRILYPFSVGNVFCIGDTAGSSSPLAGLGGTLGLTLVPCTVKQLIDDYEKQSKRLHENFKEYSNGYTSRWIEKSEAIKEFCLNVYKKEHGMN